MVEGLRSMGYFLGNIRPVLAASGAAPRAAVACLNLFEALRLEVVMTFECWLEQFSRTNKALRMWKRECQIARHVSPPRASRAAVDVANVLANVPNSVFAIGANRPIVTRNEFIKRGYGARPHVD